MKKLKLLCIICLAIGILLNSSSFSEMTYAKASEKNDTIAGGVNLVNTKTENAVGASTQSSWTFCANKTGTYNIRFTYARPWEKKASDVKSVEYKIKVTGKKGSTIGIPALMENKLNIVNKDQKFSVVLKQNASTGYSWSYTADKKVIKLKSKRTFNLVGAPVEKVWTFQANKSGIYKLKFTYTRSWEKDAAPAKTAEYTVNVSDKTSTASDSTALIESKDNNVDIGQKFFISLEENASTGYSWNYTIDNNAISPAK